MIDGTCKRAGITALFFALLLCAALFSCGNDDAEDPAAALAPAEHALGKGDIAEAEALYERFLRTHPEGPLRRKAWDRLLEITLNIRQDKATAREYLEVMRLEYAEQPEDLRAVELALAALCNAQRDDACAVPLWEKSAADPSTPAEVKAPVYRDLAAAYMRRLEFTPAVDALQACLELEVGVPAKGECLYDMAEINMLTEDPAAAERNLRTLLSWSADLSEDLRVRAVFLLADVVEQRGSKAEALSLFEGIRDKYPNAKVVEMRITSLKNQKK